MLTEDEMWTIENKAVQDYLDSVQNNKYKNEVIHGDIQKWTDADDYYTLPGSCTVPGTTIKEWLIDNFESTIDEFLYKSSKCKSFDEIAEDEDLADEDSYYNFIFDKCDDIEEYFWSSDVFEELCNEYFEENGEAY